MIDQIKVIKKALKDYSVPKKLLDRYSNLLLARAVRFYIEGNLDEAVVQEDLYNGEDFDCGCTQTEADRNRHNPKCEYRISPYPNLAYSEKENKA